MRANEDPSEKLRFGIGLIAPTISNQLQRRRSFQGLAAKDQKNSRVETHARFPRSQ